MIKTRRRDYAWNKGWIEFEGQRMANGRGRRIKRLLWLRKGNIAPSACYVWDHEKPGDLAVRKDPSPGRDARPPSPRGEGWNLIGLAYPRLTPWAKFLSALRACARPNCFAN